MAKHKEIERASISLHPYFLCIAIQKRTARRKVNLAVSSGRLHKPDHCEHCEGSVSSNDLQAHHENYSKPLNVQWLCVPCHAMRHRHLNEWEARRNLRSNDPSLHLFG